MNVQFFAQHAYYFLTQTLSAPQTILLRHLGAFRGDVLRDTFQHASSCSPGLSPDYDDEYYSYLLQQIAGLVSVGNADRINSAQLACALTLFNLTPVYEGRIGLAELERAVKFEYSDGNSFWRDHGLTEGQVVALARDLATYDGSEVLQADLSSRFSLCITATPGKVTVCPTERWGFHQIARPDGTTTARELILPERALLRPDQLDEFAQLLRTPSVAEFEWQKFLDANSEFLYLLGDYEAHRREFSLRLQVSFDEAPEPDLRPDFMLKRIGLNLWDILETKLPTVDVVVGPQSRRRLSSGVASGLSQIRRYAQFFQDRTNYRWFRESYGHAVSTPRLYLLAGRDTSFRDEREKSTFADAEGVRIVTYDDLYRIARHRCIRVDPY